MVVRRRQAAPSSTLVEDGGAADLDAGDGMGDDFEEEQEGPGDDGESEEGQRMGPATSGYPGGDEEWEEIFVCPLGIRFTQDKIHPFFYRRGPIVNVVPKIRTVEHAGDDVLDLVPPFAPIHCLRKGTELWSMDNRRLYALQLTAMDLWPRRCRVRCLSRERLSRHKFKTQYRKFNTTSEGRSIDVCTRYQQFDNWSWYERAIELEKYQLSKRLGMMLFIFEVAPILGAILFRSGLTGFSSRVPLVVGFVLALTVDLLRQKVPAFERKLCELQVKAIMDGEVLQFTSWWRGQEDDDEIVSGVSVAQLAATMAIALMLLLPYILGVVRDKIRSSLFSCWLGVAFMLVVQLATTSWHSWGSAEGPTSLPGKLRRIPKESRNEDDDGDEDEIEDDAGQKTNTRSADSTLDESQGS
eukprot:gb/GFBE01045660.1/.p1 GENE.gb/GFBE01045660.1/~~gb/GFBE01045660.1/.p1  ORF type:complete len:412 (+),score=63.86 gb/GFBE01045660.1/:1-1236(+)